MIVRLFEETVMRFDMVILMTLLVIFWPVIVVYRLVSGDSYMPPRDRIR